MAVTSVVDFLGDNHTEGLVVCSRGGGLGVWDIVAS